MTVTLKDGVIQDDTTGEWVRTAKLGTRPASPTAITQTYSTTATTMPAGTAVDPVTTGVTQASPWGFATAAQGDAVVTAVIALNADILALKKIVNSVIDALQASGHLA